MELCSENFTQPVIVVHGGAGTGSITSVPPDCIEGTKEAAIKGYRLLENKGSCIDAVVDAVSCMEDSPHFNAGRGAYLNVDGEVELHAMVMRGDTCDIGGVVGIKHIKNPIKAARLVLDKSHHCLLNSEASLKLARQYNLEEKPLDYFVTDYSSEMLQQSGSNFGLSIEKLFGGKHDHDTVGAVAVDYNGNIACATSTGGITAQLVGRISDSALSGSGGFADNNSVAVSTTGHGESIMKVNLARMISLYVENGMSPQEAIEKSVSYMEKRVNGKAGAIAVDTKGRTGIYNNTPVLLWARIGAESCHDRDAATFVEYGHDLTNIKKEKL